MAVRMRPGTRAVLLGLTGVVAVAGVALFMVHWLRQFADGMCRHACASNLREIQKLCSLHADAEGGGFYPYAAPGDAASLQAVAALAPGVWPAMFICPASADPAALVKDGGAFALDEGHTSYAMVAWRLSREAPGESLVAFDRRPTHRGKRNVIHADGTVACIDEAEFLRQVERDRQRFSHPSGAHQGVKP